MVSLIGRAALGFVFLMVCLVLVLFVSAGSLAFWQAWVYLWVFAVCTILITAYLIGNDPKLLAGRVQAGPLAETQRSQKIIQSLASFFFLGLFIVAGLDRRFQWSDIQPGLSLIGDGLVTLGFFIVFLVFRENTYSHATIDVSEGQKVITSGPYSVVRHPMYAGAALLLIFTPLALGSWVAMPFSLPLILVVAVRLREEEAFLLGNLSGYEEYRQKVHHRLSPFVW